MQHSWQKYIFRAMVCIMEAMCIKLSWYDRRLIISATSKARDLFLKRMNNNVFVFKLNASLTHSRLLYILNLIEYLFRDIYITLNHNFLYIHTFLYFFFSFYYYFTSSHVFSSQSYVFTSLLLMYLIYASVYSWFICLEIMPEKSAKEGQIDFKWYVLDS